MLILTRGEQTLHLATRITMATSHGQLTTFSGNPDNWEAFIEQLESYFAANDITAAGKKRGILLSSCGMAAYKTIQSIVAPTKPTEIAYNELVAKVKAHFAPKPSAIVQRYKFNTCTRNQGESVASYVSRLRALTPFCDFGDTNMLRDCLVCGINHEQLQRRLLAEPNLCFSKAMEIAQTFESAVQDARHFQEGPKPPQPLPVNALQKSATATTLTSVTDVEEVTKPAAVPSKSLLATTARRRDT